MYFGSLIVLDFDKWVVVHVAFVNEQFGKDPSHIMGTLILNISVLVALYSFCLPVCSTPQGLYLRKIVQSSQFIFGFSDYENIWEL